MNIRNEIKRKLIHSTTIFIPIMYSFLSRREMLYITGILLIIALLVEITRFIWNSFSVFFQRIFSAILRDDEKKCLTGATFIFLGIFLSLLFYENWIAQSVMLFIIISDAFSAIVGRVWGKHKLYGNKTLEGCLAYGLSSFIIIYFIIEGDVIIGIAGIIASLIAEIFITRIDDNVSVAVIGGGTMQLLYALNI